MDLNQSEWSNKSSSKESNVIIDVRTSEEFDERFIKNAINLNIYESSEFVEKIKSFFKK